MGFYLVINIDIRTLLTFFFFFFCRYWLELRIRPGKIGVRVTGRESYFTFVAKNIY